MSIFGLIAKKKQAFRETKTLNLMKKAEKATAMRKELEKQKMLREEIAKTKAVKKEARDIKFAGLKKGLAKVKETGAKMRERSVASSGGGRTFKGSSQRQDLGSSARNIHEGVGRNIWYDKPKAVAKPKKKEIIIRM